MRFSEERKQWLKDFAKEHKDDMPRRYWAKEAGVSVDKWYDLIRTAGGKMTRISPKSRPEYEDVVRREIDNLTFLEMSQKYGGHPDTFASISRRLGLKRSDEFNERIMQRRKDALKKGRDTLNRMSMSGTLTNGATLKRTYQKERRRAEYGLRQKTRLHLSTAPHRVFQRKWYLCKRYGYIDTTAAYLLWYDENTERDIEREEYFNNRYGIKFEQYGKEKEENRQAVS